MANRKFVETVPLGGGKHFCEMFMRDFRLQKDIEFIEPDAKADRYDDPVWQPYKSRCTNLSTGIFDSYHCEPKIAQSLEQLPKAQRDSAYRSSCQHYRGTANFKHYLVNISDRGEKEHVFYHEREEGPLNRPGAEQDFGNGGYWIVDLDRCRFSQEITPRLGPLCFYGTIILKRK